MGKKVPIYEFLLTVCGKTAAGLHFPVKYLACSGGGPAHLHYTVISLCRIFRRQDRPTPHPRHGSMQAHLR